uniref:Candidate secreted effector n=1 Tax=Meloidogyne incognita TaxID=6306 RepID=A0A914M8Q5_MELIC
MAFESENRRVLCHRFFMVNLLFLLTRFYGTQVGRSWLLRNTCLCLWLFLLFSFFLWFWR